MIERLDKKYDLQGLCFHTIWLIQSYI